MPRILLGGLVLFLTGCQNLSGASPDVAHFLTFTLLTVGMVSLFMTAGWQSTSPAQSEEQDADFSFTDFDSVDVNYGIQILVTAGTTYSVSVRGNRRHVGRLSFSKEGRTLYISRKGVPRFRSLGVHVTITMPELRAITCTGGCLAKATGFYNSDRIRLDATGASSLTWRGKARHLEAQAVGASHMKLEGEVEFLNVEATGASSIEGYNCVAENAEVEATGASHAKVCVQKLLKAYATAASSIRYRGDAIVESEATAASSVSGKKGKHGRNSKK